MTRTYFTYIYIKFPISLKMYTQLRLDLQGFLSAFIFMYWILFSHFKCTHPYHVWRNRLKQILQSCLGLGLGQFLNLCMAPPCPCRLPPDLAPSCDLGPPTQHRPAWAAGLWATLVTLTRSALLCSACVGVVGQTVGTALRAAAPGSPSIAEQPALAAECAHLKR